MEYDIIARGLLGLDAQIRERWQLGCKNRLGNICWAPEIERNTFLEQNDGDVCYCLITQCKR